jgi:hypothetical protein
VRIEEKPSDKRMQRYAWSTFPPGGETIIDAVLYHDFGLNDSLKKVLTVELKMIE